MDAEVFASLPREMQQEILSPSSAAPPAQAQAAGWDPEALAALPPEMREEIMEAEARRQRLAASAADDIPADPSHAQEMDNASFVASLAPDLRAEILLQADEQFLSTLSPNLVAEARVLQERAPRRFVGGDVEEAGGAAAGGGSGDGSSAAGGGGGAAGG
ncbi:hypothetical protein JKP88DRAFT_149411, partial [Tribonema minus]